MADQCEVAFPKTLADLRLADSSLVDTSIPTDSNIYKILDRLRKSTLSIPNRLRSILHDASFVAALYSSLNTVTPAFSLPVDTPHLSFPLVANERCGSWYIPPALRQQSLSATSSPNRQLTSSAYFKSTDGHVSQWSFSLRRLNLPLLTLLGISRGAILVDSTRRGKAYPDALRRTVPIWVAVWNRVLFPEDDFSWSWALQVKDLEDGEVSLIEGRLGRFVEGLKGLGLDLNRLRDALVRPIRCVWVANCEQEHWEERFAEVNNEVRHMGTRSGMACNVLVLCSASRRVVGAEMSESRYIQGAGDDSEGWAHGLTPHIFWTYKEQFMQAGEGEIDVIVDELVKQEKAKARDTVRVLVQPTENLFICATGDDRWENGEAVIDCNGARDHSSTFQLMLGCRQGKLGSRDLRDRLPLIRDFVSKVFAKSPVPSVVVSCSSGKDLSVGVLLAILCMFYDTEGKLIAGSKAGINADSATNTRLTPDNAMIDKQVIKQRLAWITTSKPDANPSRSTLQAVNSFLMDRLP